MRYSEDMIIRTEEIKAFGNTNIRDTIKCPHCGKIYKVTYIKIPITENSFDYQKISMEEATE